MSAPNFVPSDSNFAENIWKDSFITFSLDIQAYEMYARDIQKLKNEVRTMLLAYESKIVDKMILINKIHRLGISYLFPDEIEEQIKYIFELNISFQDCDLYTTSLLFRLFRQQGYKISSEIFKKFLDEKDKFKKSLSVDIKGMLSLFEAAQVRTYEDSILEEAHVFTKTELRKNIQNCSNSFFVKQVNRALNHCLHKGAPRLEAHYYMTIYDEDEFQNEQLLMLAKLDYNLLQMLHKEELSELSRWEGGEIQEDTDCIKICLTEIMKIYDEVEDSLKKKGSSLGLYHLKEAIKQFAKSSNIEAKWLLKRGELPPFTEYLKNASFTIGFHVTSVTSLLGMKFATKEVFDWIQTFPKIILSSMELCRLLNDLASHKIEKRRGNATGIDCYMKSCNVSESEAINKFEEMIEEKWKEINEELLYSITVPREVLTIMLNLNRSANTVYNDQEDGYTEPQKTIVPYITAMILDPVSI